MTREDIIRMAVDAGIIPWTKHEYVGGKNFSASDEGLDGDLASLIQFAELVASAERERCAELRSQLHFFCFDKPSSVGKQELVGLVNQALDDYQKLIRTGNV